MILSELVPGKKLNNDWFGREIPRNIEIGENCLIDSSHCFKNYHSQLNIGLKIGSNVVFSESSLAVEENGFLEIGSNCFFSSCSIIVSKHISIGDNVFIAGGVTIVDSNFHPLEPAQRINDIVSLSPVGDRQSRPTIESAKVVIGNNVWIGFNATIMKGVNVGDDVIIEPGSVVISDIKAGNRVSGNPAKNLI